MASLWRHGSFLKLWSAQVFSLLGSQVTLIALPLTAIVLLHATPVEVGTLTALGYLPFLLVALPAGVWIESMPRRSVLIAADFGRAVLLAAVPVAYALDRLTLELLYPIVFLSGILTVFFDVAYQSYLPSLVTNEGLVEANTKLHMSHAGAQLAGPAAGGLLVQLLTAPVAIAVDAASYVLSAALLVLIPRGTAEVSQPRTISMKAAIGEGLRYVLHHRYLRPLAISMALSNFFDLFGMVQAILPLYVVRELGASGLQLGIILAIANGGALLGAAVNPRVVRLVGVGPTIVISSVIPGLAVLLTPFARPATAVVVLGATLAFAGVGIALFNINQISLRQSITPPSMLARMTATMRFLIWGTIPAGAFLGGVLTGAIGARPALVIAGAGSILSSIPIFLSPLRSLREIPRG